MQKTDLLISNYHKPKKRHVVIGFFILLKPTNFITHAVRNCQLSADAFFHLWFCVDAVPIVHDSDKLPPLAVSDSSEVLNFTG
jgi:hypothetical protein